MMPPAPGRLSTTRFAVPQRSETFCATIRATRSVPPPGGFGTRKRTGRDGYCCATVGGAKSAQPSSRTKSAGNRDGFNTFAFRLSPFDLPSGGLALGDELQPREVGVEAV